VAANCGRRAAGAGWSGGARARDGCPVRPMTRQRGRNGRPGRRRCRWPPGGAAGHDGWRASHRPEAGGWWRWRHSRGKAARADQGGGGLGSRRGGLSRPTRPGSWPAGETGRVRKAVHSADACLGIQPGGSRGAPGAVNPTPRSPGSGLTGRVRPGLTPLPRGAKKTPGQPRDHGRPPPGPRAFPPAHPEEAFSLAHGALTRSGAGSRTRQSRLGPWPAPVRAQPRRARAMPTSHLPPAIDRMTPPCHDQARNDATVSVCFRHNLK